MADVEVRPLPPAEAITYFEGKGLSPSFAWQDVWQQEHAKAFTVAKSTGFDILGDVHQAVGDALKNGTTLEQFRKDLRPTLEAKGWWGKQPVVDPQTGETVTAQLGSGRRLKTIYETNLRTAYAAGRWERMQAAKAALPFLVYHHTPGEKFPRPEHEAWDGTKLPIDDPWWKTHYTPNGWGCNCWVTQVSVRDSRPVTDKPIQFPPKTYVNPRTGEVSQVEQGIDPGWSYNVGQAPLEGISPKPSPLGVRPEAGARPQRDLPELPPGPAPPPLPKDASAEEAQASFFGALDLRPGESRIDADPDGHPLVLGPGLFHGSGGRPAKLTKEQLRQLPLAAAALANPHEIWWVWRAAASGPRAQLLRRYIARLHDGERMVDVAVDMVAAGSGPSWAFATSLQDSFDLDALRTGKLAWRYEPPTAAELEALSEYTGSGHRGINARLRGEEPGDESIERAVAVLDGLLQRQRLRRYATFYRGMNSDGVASLGSIAPGSVITDPAFMSTSRSIDTARSFANTDGDEDAIIFEILAEAGSRAMDVSSLSSHPHELETLFSRGARLKVLSWNPDERILTVEVVPGD